MRTAAAFLILSLCGVAEHGVVHASTGSAGKAQRLQDELPARSQTTCVSPMSLAVPIAPGELDDAIHDYELAFEPRDPLLIAATTWPPLLPVRDDPRVVRLLAQVGIA